MTPTQARLFAERKERLARIACRALVQNVAVIAKQEMAEAARPAMTIKQAEVWMATQLEQVVETSVPKLWFSIADRPGEVSINTIQRTVCAHFNVSMRDLLSGRRLSSIVLPRHVAYYLAKTLTKKSLPDIGRRFGGRDHTTILHGVRRVTTLIVSGHPIARDVEVLVETLEKRESGNEEARANSLDLCPSEAQEPSGPDQRASQPPGERAPVLGPAE